MTVSPAFAGARMRLGLAALAATLVALLLAAGAARADTTIDTTPSWDGSQAIGRFGDPNTATYGQVITAPSGDTTLQDFTFYMQLPTDLIFRGEVYAWDGSKATGPNLYESAATHTTDDSVFQPITFHTDGLQLAAGQKYVLFGTISHDQATDGGHGRTGVWGRTDDSAYSGGTLMYLNNGYDDSRWTTQNWSDSCCVGDMAFKATFSNGRQADLSLTKTASTATTTVGSQFSYTIPVRNDGPNSANVTVTDPLPANVRFVSASSTKGSCSGAASVSCSLGSLASGDSATVTINVTATGTGQATNTASVAGDATDPNSANNSASATTTINAAAAPAGPSVTARCIVPNLRHKTLSKARSMLRANDCRLGKANVSAAARRRGMLVVLRSSPKAGAVLPGGALVSVRLVSAAKRVARPRPHFTG